MPNIKLKDRNGNDVIYQNILSVTFDTDDGGTVTFVYVEENKGTTASIVDDVLVLNGATVNEENVLALENASIDENGYLVIEKEVE